MYFSHYLFLYFYSKSKFDDWLDLVELA